MRARRSNCGSGAGQDHLLTRPAALSQKCLMLCQQRERRKADNLGGSNSKMRFLRTVTLIQGGMGIYVSTWRLARAVSMERPGETAGTVSGTALDIVYIRLLQLGDPGGHVRRALDAFDHKFGIDIGRRIRDKFFIAGGKNPSDHFKGAPMQTLRSSSGLPTFHLSPGDSAPKQFELDVESVELLIASGFAEVWLAKEGHNGNIFINFLNKIELPLIYSMYGAMLAGVDGIVVGAGNPEGLAASCSHLAKHEPVSRNLSVLYRETGQEFSLSFDPKQIAGGKCAKTPLKRPAFLAIVSLQDLVKALAEGKSDPPDGYIIEHHTAGGHNANPVGPLRRDVVGQPIYAERDEPDLEAIRKVGMPFWLAGGYDSHEKLEEALAAGATGVQVGSIFALSEESGMRPDYRTAILNDIRMGTEDAPLVRTTLFSPTGFAFKVVQLKDTLADPQVYEDRQRVCDIGLLQQLGLSKPGEDGSRRLFRRCSAGPIAGYIKERGLASNTEERRCLCNALLSCVGLGQIRNQGEPTEEPAIVTLGNHLDGIRRLSRHGQAHYWAKDVVADILG
jgi:NAD(P)H-dependent flavin oxidoreductase YrpB (nitropropane dioxygenase family)